MTFEHSKLPDENRTFLLGEAPVGAEGYAWQQALQADRDGYLYIENSAVIRAQLALDQDVTLKIRRVEKGVEVLLSTVKGLRRYGHIFKENYLPVMLILDIEPEQVIPVQEPVVVVDEKKRVGKVVNKKPRAK